MKQCPFCAEDIQDAALICKHCSKDGGNRNAIRDPSPTVATSRRAAWLGVVAAAVLGVYLLGSMPSAGADSGGGGYPGTAAPLVIEIASSSMIDIPAGASHEFTWNAPEGRQCHIVGRIEVLRGGNKDVQVFLLPSDDNKNLQNGHAAKGFLSTDKITVVTLDERIRHGGEMVLSVSNRHSVLTGKRVQFSGVKAMCR